MKSALRLVAMFCVGFVGVGLSQSVQHIAIGNSEVTLPGDWQLVSKNEDRSVYRSADGAEQVTLSVLRFQRTPTFDDFKVICEKRLEAVRKVLQDAFVEPDKSEPQAVGEKFVMFYSGGDRKTGRIFSDYLSQKGTELLTVYVEGIHTDATKHLETFKQIVASVKRN